jgi:hypothetical protein
MQLLLGLDFRRVLCVHDQQAVKTARMDGAGMPVGLELRDNHRKAVWWAFCVFDVNKNRPSELAQRFVIV